MSENNKRITKQMLAWISVIICSGFSLFCLFGTGLLLYAYFTDLKYSNNNTLMAACYIFMGFALTVTPTLGIFAWIFRWKGFGWDSIDKPINE